MTRADLLLPFLALLGLASAGYYDPYQGGYAACGAPYCVSQYLRFGSCSGLCAPCTPYVRIYVIRLCRSPTCLDRVGYGPCAFCGKIFGRVNAVPYGPSGYAVHPGYHAKLAHGDFSGFHGNVNRYLGGPSPLVHNSGFRRFPLYNARLLYPLQPRVRFGVTPYGPFLGGRPNPAPFQSFRVCGSPYCVKEYLTLGSCRGLCRPCIGVVTRYVLSLCSSSLCTGESGGGFGICRRCGALFPWLGGLGGHLGSGHVVQHPAVHAGAAPVGVHLKGHHAVHAGGLSGAHAAVQHVLHAGVHPGAHHAIHALAHGGVHPGVHTGAEHLVHEGTYHGVHPLAHLAVHNAVGHEVHPLSHAGVHPAAHLSVHPGVAHGAHPLAHPGSPVGHLAYAGATGLNINIHKVCSTTKCSHEYEESGHCSGACQKCESAYAHVCKTKVCRTQYETQSSFAGNCGFCDGYYTNTLYGDVGRAVHHPAVQGHVPPHALLAASHAAYGPGGHLPILHGGQVTPVHHALSEFPAHAAASVHSDHGFAHAQSGPGYAHAQAGSGYAHAQSGKSTFDHEDDHKPEESSGSSDSHGYYKLKKKIDPDLYRIHLAKLKAHLNDKKAKITHDVNKRKKK